MTQREAQLLKYIFSVLGGLFVVGFFGYQFFWKPFQENRLTLARLQYESDEKMVQIGNIHKGKVLLQRARMQSLPSNLNIARTEYRDFLIEELRDCNLVPDTLKEVTIEAKPVNVGAGKKETPPHNVLAFLVQTKGSLTNFVAFLERIKSTPLMHRIKSFTITRPEQTTSAKDRSSGTLTVSMVIEALVVSRAENHTEGLLGPEYRLVLLDALAGLQRGPVGLGMLTWAMGPTGPRARYLLKTDLKDRTYADLSYRNIFTGLVPPPKNDVVREADDAIDIRDWVRLAQITHRELDTGRIKYSALLRNYFTDPNDAFVSYVKLSLDLGYRTFAIKNESLTKTVLRGHVLKIEPHQVYFQVSDEAYRIGLGEKVSEALRRPLEEAELKEAGVTLLEPDPEDVLLPTKTERKGGKKQKR